MLDRSNIDDGCEASPELRNLVDDAWERLVATATVGTVDARYFRDSIVGRARLYLRAVGESMLAQGLSGTVGPPYWD